MSREDACMVLAISAVEGKVCLIFSVSIKLRFDLNITVKCTALDKYSIFYAHFLQATAPKCPTKYARIVSLTNRSALITFPVIPAG
jgi:hypothetical protein